MFMVKNRFRTCKAGLIPVVLPLLMVCGCDYFKTEQMRLEDARFLYQEGDYNTAAIELKKLLQSDERNVEARVLLGKIQLWLGQSRQAESQFAKAIEYGASREQLAIPMAKAYLAVGKYSQVLNELPPDASLDPENRAELMVLRGRAYKALSQQGRARAEFERALATKPDFAQAYLGLAEVSLAERAYREAELLIERVVAEDSAYPDALLLKSRILMEQAQYAEAEALFTELIDQGQVVLSPMQEFRALTGLAEAQFRQGKMDVAIKSVNNLERRYPRHPMPKYMVALVEYARGNYAKAVSYLQSILQIAPNYPSAQFLIGASNYALNNLEQASFYLSRAVDVEPENGHARKLLAMTYMRLNEPGKARELLQRSMLSEDAGDNSELLMMLGKVSLQSGNIDAGLDYIERSVESGGGGEADLQMELAAAYIASGKPELGAHILEGLPDNGEYDYRKGVLEVMARIKQRETIEAQEKAETL
ncbi:MAG TPA: tetratricopeptide repeat protein, partial [Gammaproteobacteria bacterium]